MQSEWIVYVPIVFYSIVLDITSLMTDEVEADELHMGFITHGIFPHCINYWQHCLMLLCESLCWR